jgi:hypothetical protein
MRAADAEVHTALQASAFTPAHLNIGNDFVGHRFEAVLSFMAYAAPISTYRLGSERIKLPLSYILLACERSNLRVTVNDGLLFRELLYLDQVLG